MLPAPASSWESERPRMAPPASMSQGETVTLLSLGGSSKISRWVGPRLFQMTASALGPGLCEILSAPCKEVASPQT